MNFIPAQVYGRGRSVVVLLALAVTFLSGCVAPIRVPISSDSRAQLGTVNGIVGLRQQEIGTDIIPSNLSNAMGSSGGAIGSIIGSIADASIDNARAKKAESAVKPIRDALIDYQPGNVLAADLQKALATVPGASPSHVDVRQVIDPETTAKWINGSGNASVLLVTLNYKLSPNFDSIVISAEASLHAGGNRLANIAQTKPDLPPLVYYNDLSTTVALPGLNGPQSPEGMVTLWAADGGQPARTALNAGLQELAAMIAYDLTAPAPLDGKLYKAPKDAETRQVTIIAAPPYQYGYVEHTAEGRAWLRLPSGELAAIIQ
jgi:hypothetical protein